MTLTRKLLGAVAGVIGVGTLLGVARAQVVTPRPEELRFEAVLNEPIAAPDHRSVVAGTSALLVRDRRTGQCFLAVSLGNDLGVAPARCEP